MIRSIIIDDEKAAINALSKKLEIHCDGIDIVAKCNSSKEGLLAISTLKPDLLFLDIEMPWMNGFELLSCLGDQLDFNVVFVTAYDQYAIQAFKVKAIDYLLKPVDKDDLINCVNRVKSDLQKLNKHSLNDLIGEMNKPIEVTKIMIHSTEGMEVLPLNEIIYCQAASNYTYIFTTDNRKIVVSKTLADIESSLGPKFFVRTHKSYHVNLSCVQKYSNIEGGELILKNGVKVPVSRRKKSEVLEAINNFI